MLLAGTARAQTTEPPHPFFIGLGDLPGGTTSSAANGLSFDGGLVAGQSNDQNGQQAVAWRVTKVTSTNPTPSVQMVQLSLLPASTNGNPGTAKAITLTPTGQVYVAGSTTGLDPNTNTVVTQAIRWQLNSDNSSTALALGFLSPQDPSSDASGITQDGSAVIGTSNFVDPASGITNTRAAYYQIDAQNNVTRTALPNLPPNGGLPTLANGITRVTTPSGVRDIIGGAGELNSEFRAAKWTVDPLSPTSANPPEVLPNFATPGSPPIEASANAISADGNTLVGYSLSNQNGADTIEAALWNANTGTVTQLGDLPGGKFESKANGVSGDGKLVVGYGSDQDQSGNFRQEAFIYFVGDSQNPGVMLPLKDFLTTYLHLGGELVNWELTNAFAISADGTTIAGVGRHTLTDGTTVDEGFYVVIPEPTGLALIGAGGALLLRRRRRKAQRAG